MSLVNSYRKPISMFVTIAFTVMLCFWANQAPAAPGAPAAEKSSDARLENSEAEGTGYIEQEAPERAYKKGRGFPWLLVAFVLAAGGAALYFLVLKKKNYTLTVTVGEGASGTPAAGTSTHQKGTVINYSYALQGGYSNLLVTLDGAPVAASGTVTMNGNHTLDAKATKTFVLTVSKGEHVNGTPNSGTYSYARGTNVPYSYAPASGFANLQVKLDNVAVANAGTIAMDANHTLTTNLQGANIEVNSNPAGAKIYLNNVNSGFTTPHTFVFPAAVTRTVMLSNCGYKDFSQTVSVNMGQTAAVNAVLVPGIREDFNVPPSSCWVPLDASSWDHTGGEYRYSGSALKYATNVYNAPFLGNYSVTVKLNRKAGAVNNANSIFLGTTPNMFSANGYLLECYQNGQYAIFRLTNYNLLTNTGVWLAIKAPTAHAAILSGLNKWNKLKMVRSGSNYTVYINNTLITSFVDATYDPLYFMLAFYCGSIATTVEVEYVYLDIGGAADSVPGLPVKADTGVSCHPGIAEQPQR